MTSAVGAIRSVVRSARPLLLGCVAACLPPSLSGQAVPPAARAVVDSAAFRVTVVANVTGKALPFAIISVASIAFERFTNEQGQLAVPSFPVGKFHVRVRQLGYTPVDVDVTIAPNVVNDIVIHMTHIAQQLTAMSVSADWRCDAPGLPKNASAKTLAMFEQLEQNADRMRLLQKEFPFVVYVDRWQLMLRTDGSDTTIRRDTTTLAGSEKETYKPGGVVYQPNKKDKPLEHFMRIPTLQVFADPVFQANHCFLVRGIDREKDNALRIDFKTSRKVKTPDVEGSVFLDTASYRLVRAEIKLTSVPKELTGILGMSVITLFTEVSAGLPIIGAVHAVTELNATNFGNDFYITVEKQSPVKVMFLKGRPGKTPPSVADTAHTH